MSAPKRDIAVVAPPLAVDAETAAAMLAMGRTKFDELVAPKVRAYRNGRLRCYVVADLEAWLHEHSTSLPGAGR